MGEENPNWSTHFQQANNITAISVGDEKSIPALKSNIVWDMADMIPYLFLTQFQELISPS